MSDPKLYFAGQALSAAATAQLLLFLCGRMNHDLRSKMERLEQQYGDAENWPPSLEDGDKMLTGLLCFVASLLLLGVSLFSIYQFFVC